jgi:hypothetical protein
VIERFDAYLTPTEARNRAASVDGGRAWSEGDKQHATYVYLGQDAEVAGDLGKAAELYSKA